MRHLLGGFFFDAAAHRPEKSMPKKCTFMLTGVAFSGVSLVFTGIICSTFAAAPELVQIVQGTIAAAAVINEFIAVIAAKKGFELAGEIRKA